MIKELGTVNFHDGLHINESPLFKQRTVLHDLNTSPKVKDFSDLQDLLSIKDIFKEITKNFSHSEILNLLSLNQYSRTLTSERFRLVFTPHILFSLENEDLELAQQSKLNIKISKLDTLNDSRQLVHFIQDEANNSFINRITTLEFISVNYENQVNVQTLLNLLHFLPCLTYLSFRGIWKPITIPKLDELKSISLGRLWSPIIITNPTKLTSLNYDEINKQPETQKMLEDLRATIKLTRESN